MLHQDWTNLATDCGRVWKKGAVENFARKLRLLSSGGDTSRFLTSLCHYDCLASPVTTSRSASAVQPQCIWRIQAPSGGWGLMLSLGVTFSLRESKLLCQKLHKHSYTRLETDTARCQLGGLLLLSSDEFKYWSARSQNVKGDFSFPSLVAAQKWSSGDEAYQCMW